MAVMVEVRTKLIEEAEKISSKDLSHHIKSNSLTYMRNFRVLLHLTENLKIIKEHLDSKLDDNARWIKILGTIYDEADHYKILLNTNYSDHFWEYHEETLCRCWSDARVRLFCEFATIRQRLFGPI